MITITAFKWVPPMAQGLVRDLRVRWALEEAGIPYDVQLIDPSIQRSEDYLAMQPFGQVPVLIEDNLTIFESGSIVLHIGEKSEVLLPKEEAPRRRAVTWVISALNSIEIAVVPLAQIDLFYAGEAWAKERRPAAAAFLHSRLADLSVALGDKPYLDGNFTAGDLMMVAVLRNLRHTNLIADYPNLAAYMERCQARPAFQRALEGQMSAFRAHAA